MSRDLNRIPKVLAALGELWMEHPDLRLGQIMGNASITFYTEDDRALTELTKWRDYYRDSQGGHRAMTADPIYCTAQTYRATRDMPAEYCETEVDNEGDLCARHDEDDRADELYDNYLESLRKE